MKSDKPMKLTPVKIEARWTCPEYEALSPETKRELENLVRNAMRLHLERVMFYGHDDFVELSESETSLVEGS